jgi:hypothetical protein
MDADVMIAFFVLVLGSSLCAALLVLDGHPGYAFGAVWFGIVAVAIGGRS